MRFVRTYLQRMRMAKTRVMCRFGDSLQHPGICKGYKVEGNTDTDTDTSTSHHPNTNIEINLRTDTNTRTISEDS